uniref:Uncharacterized protein n=1 Tax=Piliocolobus tephrosceles TaxID=591936 RepID=A0A8C9GAP1_9PRIM
SCQPLTTMKETEKLSPDIDLDSENILWEYFKNKTNDVGLLKRNSAEKFQINYDKHITVNKKYNLHYMTTDHIVSRFNKIINNMWKQQCGYNPSYFHEILKTVEEKVKSASTQKRYTFTNTFIIDLCVCLFQRATENFKEIHRAFKRANDPVNYIESKKDDCFTSFKISCQGATSIKIFVDVLWYKLTPAVSTIIWEEMTIKIAGDMRATCPAFDGNRTNLEKHILISLAEEENFDN